MNPTDQSPSTPNHMARNPTSSSASSEDNQKKSLPAGGLTDIFNSPRVNLLNASRPGTVLTADDAFLQDILKEGETNKLVQKTPDSTFWGSFAKHPVPSAAWSSVNNDTKKQLNHSGSTVLPGPTFLGLADPRTQYRPLQELNAIAVGRRNPPGLGLPTPMAPPGISRPVPFSIPAHHNWGLSPAFTSDTAQLIHQRRSFDFTTNYGSFPPGTQEHVLIDHPGNYLDLSAAGLHIGPSFQHRSSEDLSNEPGRRRAELQTAFVAAPMSNYSQHSNSSNGTVNANGAFVGTPAQNPSQLQAQARRPLSQTQHTGRTDSKAKPSGYYPNSQLPSSRARAEGFRKSVKNSTSNENQQGNQKSNIERVKLGSVQAKTSGPQGGSDHPNHGIIASAGFSTQSEDPSKEAKEAKNLLNNTRGVFIRNVPPTITLSQVCSNIRGGAVERISVGQADGQTDIAVYFVLSDTARVYKHFTNRVGGIYWTGAEHVGSFPSFTAFIGPGNGGHDRLKENIRDAINHEGATRCLLFRGLPASLDEEKLLRDIKLHLKITKLSFESLETRVEQKVNDSQPVVLVTFRFASIGTAVAAKKAITTNETYKGVQISFVADECARPLQELSDRWKLELEQTHGVQAAEGTTKNKVNRIQQSEIGY